MHRHQPRRRVGFVVVAAGLLLLAACQIPGPEEDVQARAETTPQMIMAEPEPVPEPEPEPEPSPELWENPFSEAALLQSAQIAHYSIYTFAEGRLYSNGDSPGMPSASVIKVFIMQYAYSLIGEGLLSEDDVIGWQTVRTLIERMIQQSDNIATNTLIDHFGMENLNQFFLAQGYTETVLQRRMLDMDARAQGLDNYTSTGDTMAFLRRLYENRLTFPYNEMLAIMEGQLIRTKIPSFLPFGTVVAHKTGELYDVENDIGLVFTEDAVFAIVVLTEGVWNGEATRQAIGQLALEAYLYVTARG